MGYSSLAYLLLFVPGVLLVYRILPQRRRWILLLAASYGYYIFFSLKLVAALLTATAVIYLFGLWLARNRDRYEALRHAPEGSPAAPPRAVWLRRRRGILWLGILILAGLLFFFKYFNFFGSTVNSVLGLFSLPAALPTLKLVMPLGISFYTLSAISYLADVHGGKIEADRNPARLALFLSFFPTIMEGPICRYSDSAQALFRGDDLKFQNLAFGAQRVVWGLFKKIVLADRLNPIVDQIFNHYDQYGGITVILGAILYTFQLYMDFSGCIDITLGVGEMFGITLPENFRQPFFSRTSTEFWHRWHITLGTWFKDYIFFPLSLTRGVKKLGKKARARFGRHVGPIVQSLIPMMAVWLCNGLWHGAGWHYIFYGVYYFVLITAGNLAEPLIQRGTGALHINRNGAGWRSFQAVKMLIIIFLGEMFFRANTLTAGFAMFGSIFTRFSAGVLTDGSLLKLGLAAPDYRVELFGAVLVLVVGVLHEKGISVREKAAAWHIVPRWAFYLSSVLLVIILGAYGVGYTPVDPMYAGF